MPWGMSRFFPFAGHVLALFRAPPPITEGRFLCGASDAEPALGRRRWEARRKEIPKSELEPDDSRDVTHSQNRAPGEPPRTGPREGEARAAADHQAEQGGKSPGQPFDRATEGDSPQHPDRFSGTAAVDSEAQVDQAEAQESDRWSQKADDAEDYVPEGK
jgi:hypothetical protein